jgi:hypothetical protein
VKNFMMRFSPIKELSKLPFSDYPDHMKQKIRDKAVERAEKNFIMYGKLLNDVSVSDYEHCVKEEERFGKKESLQQRFGQLSELRNALRHSRTVDEVVKMEGEAAIIWFTKLLRL